MDCHETKRGPAVKYEQFNISASDDAKNTLLHLPAIENATIAEDRREVERVDPPRRKHARVELKAEAKVRGASQGGVVGVLCDLSVGGCNLEIRQGLFSIGDLITFKIDGVEPWPGVVKWHDGVRLGIQFERPFYPAVFDAIIETNRQA